MANEPDVSAPQPEETVNTGNSSSSRLRAITGQKPANVWDNPRAADILSRFSRAEVISHQRSLAETLATSLEFKRILEHMFLDKECSRAITKYKAHYLKANMKYRSYRLAFSDHLSDTIEGLDQKELFPCFNVECTLPQCNDKHSDRLVNNNANFFADGEIADLDEQAVSSSEAESVLSTNEHQQQQQANAVSGEENASASMIESDGEEQQPAPQARTQQAAPQYRQSPLPRQVPTVAPRSGPVRYPTRTVMVKGEPVSVQANGQSPAAAATPLAAPSTARVSPMANGPRAQPIVRQSLQSVTNTTRINPIQPATRESTNGGIVAPVAAVSAMSNEPPPPKRLRPATESPAVQATVPVTANLAAAQPSPTVNISPEQQAAAGLASPTQSTISSTTPRIAVRSLGITSPQAQQQQQRQGSSSVKKEEIDGTSVRVLIRCKVEDCSETFSDIATSAEHYKTHSKLFKCSACTKLFTTRDLVYKHFSEHKRDDRRREDATA